MTESHTNTDTTAVATYEELCSALKQVVAENTRLAFELRTEEMKRHTVAENFEEIVRLQARIAELASRLMKKHMKSLTDQEKLIFNAMMAKDPSRPVDTLTSAEQHVWAKVADSQYREIYEDHLAAGNDISLIMDGEYAAGYRINGIVESIVKN